MQNIKAEAYRQLVDVYLAQRKALIDNAKATKIKANADNAKAKSTQAEAAAYNCLVNALKIYHSLGMKRNEAYTYSDLSQLKKEEGQFQDAIYFLDKAKKIYIEVGVQEDILMSNNTRAQI